MEPEKTKPQETIALLGGAFDPPHGAHLLLAEAARKYLDLETLTLLPSRQSPLKSAPQASAEHRLAMLRLVVAENPFLRIDSRELEREGESYTCLTARELRSEYPAAKIIFIIGADQALQLHRWREADKLLRDAAFRVALRPPHDATLFARLEPTLRPLMSEAAWEELAANPVPMPPMEISSSDIRARAAEGRSLRSLVPECVREYIKRNGLYRGECAS